MLLEVFFDPVEVLDDEGEFAEGVVGGVGSGDQFTVDPSAVGKAQDQSGIVSEVVLYQIHHQRFGLDARTLQGANGDEQIETSQIECREVVDIVAVKRRVGQACASQCGRTETVVDADHFEAVIGAKEGIDGGKFVAGIDPQIEDVVASGDLDLLEGMFIVAQKGRLFTLVDASKGGVDAVFLFGGIGAVKRRIGIELLEADSYGVLIDAFGREHTAHLQGRQLVPAAPTVMRVGVLFVFKHFARIASGAQVWIGSFECDDCAGCERQKVITQQGDDLMQRLIDDANGHSACIT